MSPTRYRNKWLRQLAGYEKIGNAVVSSSIRVIVDQIPYDSLTPALYREAITGAIAIQDLERMMVSLYTRVGVKHGARIGAGINKQQKAFDPNIFEPIFKNAIRDWLVQNSLQTTITSIRTGLIKNLLDFIGMKMVEGQLGFDGIITELRRYTATRDFYRWQIERIVRTEVVSAANLGAQVAAEQSGSRLDKVWISATDSRTRRRPRDIFDHLEMNGKKVSKDSAFEVPRFGGGFEKIRFPGDPKASPANRINCRCTVGYVAKRDRNGERSNQFLTANTA